jgi:Cys-tRNA(Pro)/Cys-tRNA(Cys) deacylase
MSGYVTEFSAAPAPRVLWPFVATRGTTATIALERAKIPFALHEYTHDPRADSFGLEASAALGVPPERLFKTLVATVDGGALAVGVVPVNRHLDLKALAAAVGGKKAIMAEAAVAERATGYVVGGISPVGQKRRLPIVIDASALEFTAIFCSAGRRGLQMEIAPADLIKATGAKVADIAAALKNHSSERTVATVASSAPAACPGADGSPGSP